MLRKEHESDASRNLRKPTDRRTDPIDRGRPGYGKVSALKQLSHGNAETSAQGN